MVKQIDAETSGKGYSTRSEFVRSLLRRYFAKEEEFAVYNSKPLEEVRLDLEKTGKYNKKFIESVVSGLSKSSAYAN